MSDTTHPDEIKQLVEVIRVLVTSLHDRSVDAEEGAEICRAAGELILGLRHMLPKWWQRAAAQAAANAILEAGLYLDNMAHQARGET